MTKKDYVKIAHVFNPEDYADWIVLETHKGAKPNVDSAYIYLLKRMVAVLKQDNPKFDGDKFMAK